MLDRFNASVVAASQPELATFRDYLQPSRFPRTHATSYICVREEANRLLGLPRAPGHDIEVTFFANKTS
jgi:hypothetical protein